MKTIIASFSVLLMSLPQAWAQERTYALVPKVQHPFFEQAHAGCLKAQSELGNFRCLYVGPVRSSEEEQIQILQDLIARKVDGIAVAPANAPAVGRALRRAKSANIPVITFDADVLPQDREMRIAYVGTRNYDIGVELGKRLLALKPSGGTLAIQSGGPAAHNLNERIDGLRKTLAAANWREVAGTPVYCNDDSMLAVQQMEDLLGKFSKLDAFVAVGGWPQFPEPAYRRIIKLHQERVGKGELMIVIADTLEVQMRLLRERLSHGQVGQRPFDMGYQAMRVLRDITDGKQVPEYTYTGLDVCTPENATVCLGNYGGSR